MNDITHGTGEKTVKTVTDFSGRIEKTA